MRSRDLTVLKSPWSFRVHKLKMDRPTPKLNWAQRWMRTVIELEG